MPIALQFTCIAAVCLVGGYIIGAWRKTEHGPRQREAEMIAVTGDLPKGLITVRIMDRLRRSDTWIYFDDVRAEAIARMLLDGASSIREYRAKNPPDLNVVRLAERAKEKGR